MVARFAALAFVAGATVAAAQAPSVDKRLTPADVEGVVGFPVKQIAPGSQPGAGPGLNFVGPDGKLVLMVNFGTADMYIRAKAQKEIDIGGQKVPMPLFHALVPGIGDEAFDSPPGPSQYVLYVRKMLFATSLTTYPGAGGKPALAMDDLKALGRIVVSRM